MKNPLNLLTDRANLTFESLKRWNLVLAAVYLLQAGAILLFSAARGISVTVSYLTTDSLQTKLTGEQVLAPALHQLFDVNLAYPVAAVLLIAALTHLLVATRFRKPYEAGLKKGINRWRWVECSINSGLALVILGLVVGVHDAGGLLLIFAAGALISLLGWVMEAANPLTRRAAKPQWLGFILSVGVGIVAAIVIGMYLLAAHIYGSADISAATYALYGVLIVVGMGFAAVMYLYYRQKGARSAYVPIEWWHMVWGMVA